MINIKQTLSFDELQKAIKDQYLNENEDEKFDLIYEIQNEIEKFAEWLFMHLFNDTQIKIISKIFDFDDLFLCLIDKGIPDIPDSYEKITGTDISWEKWYKFFTEFALYIQKCIKKEEES